MRQCWGLPHRLAQCTRPQRWGKLVNAALLSLINWGVCECMLRYPPLEWTRRPRLCPAAVLLLLLERPRYYTDILTPMSPSVIQPCHWLLKSPGCLEVYCQASRQPSGASTLCFFPEKNHKMVWSCCWLAAYSVCSYCVLAFCSNCFWRAYML